MSSRSRADGSVAAALDAWSAIALPELQRSLAHVPEQVHTAQRDSLASRRALADATREFKKQPMEQKVENVRALLKQYQSEIDALTRRAQASESAFLRAWGSPLPLEDNPPAPEASLFNAPDPYPLIEMLVDQAMTLADAEAVKEKYTELQAAYREVERRAAAAATTQSHVAALEEQISSLKRRHEETMAERLAASDRAWEAQLAERARNHEASGAELQRSLARLKEQVTELRAREDELTRRGLASDSTAPSVAPSHTAGEVEIMVSELERVNRRNAELERRNEDLAAESERARSGKDTTELDNVSQRLAGVERENRSLKALLDRWDQDQEEAKARFATLASEAENKRSQLQREIAALRARLEGQKDYGEIKRELLILRSVEFGGLEGQDEKDPVSPVEYARTEADGQDKSTASLERALLHKTRKLQDEVTTLRVQSSDVQRNLSLKTQEVQHLSEELTRVKGLNEKLENDLVSFNGTLPPLGPTGSSQGPAKQDSKSSLPAVPPSTMAQPSLPSRDVASSSSNSLLPIVTSQRDRFRARNTELEAEIQAHSTTIAQLRRDMGSLQQDNVGLYEKLRYLQSYGASGSQGDGFGLNHQVVPPILGSGSVYPPDTSLAQRREERYRQKYEERMDPFQAFRGRVCTCAFLSIS